MFGKGCIDGTYMYVHVYIYRSTYGRSTMSNTLSPCQHGAHHFYIVFADLFKAYETVDGELCGDYGKVR